LGSGHFWALPAIGNLKLSGYLAIGLGHLAAPAA